MRLRQAKKRLWWSKGEGNYISNHRSKNHHENYKKKYLKLRPEYYDEKRGGWVYPSCADIDIVHRANVRLGRWIRKSKKLKEQLKKDMKELINVAEELYKQIDKAQVHLVNARLNNDEEGKKSAITEMETAMCNAMQLLKCFIERKDNIVDLDKLWHKYNSKQEICDAIIARYKDNILVGVHNQCDIDIFLRDNGHLEGKVYFSFVKDLLPKGDCK